MSDQASGAAQAKRVVVYDFKRPDKFSKEQIRTVAIIHETFARLLMTRLMPLFGRPVNVHVASVDQCSYEEFIRSSSASTCNAVVGKEPLLGQALVELDPRLASSMLDILLGGRPEGELPTAEWRGARRFDPGAGKTDVVLREYTAAECEVMSDVLGKFMECIRLAWSNVIDMRPRVSNIENDPLFAQIVPPNEAVILVALSARIGDREGSIAVCIPFLTIEPIAKFLTARYWYSMIHQEKDGRSAARGMERYAGIGVEAELCVDGPVIPLRELARLRKGALFPIDREADGAAYLRMGGERVLRLRARDAKAGRTVRFDVEAGTSPDERPSAAEDATEIVESAIKKPIGELQSAFERSLADIQKGIGDIRSRQERLEESIAMGGGAVPEELGAAPLEEEPFAYLGELRPETAAGIMQKERAQLIALVSAHLDAKAASALLAALPAGIQAEVAERIARMGTVNASIVEIVDGIFRRVVSELPRNALRVSGGVEKVVDILNHAERSVERNVVDGMAASDPALAEEIKSLMFVFEDVVLIDRRHVALVLKRVDRDTLLKSMKAVPNDVRDFLWDCVDGEKRPALQEAFGAMGKVRLHDVEEAQQRIVALIREMEENGEIVVARPEDCAE